MPRTLLLAALLSAVGAALPFLGLVHAQGAAQGAATTPTPDLRGATVGAVSTAAESAHAAPAGQPTHRRRF